MDGGCWLQLEEGAMQFLALSGGMMLHLERDICWRGRPAPGKVEINEKDRRLEARKRGVQGGKIRKVTAQK